MPCLQLVEVGGTVNGGRASPCPWRLDLGMGDAPVKSAAVIFKNIAGAIVECKVNLFHGPTLNFYFLSSLVACINITNITPWKQSSAKYITSVFASSSLHHSHHARQQ
jgi:hypothetical protein